MDREISSIAETSDGSNVPIETVTWYPWYAALQREYIYVWSMSAERQQDEVLRVNVESELTAVANQLDRASVLLVIAWKSLSTRNASNWDVDVRHGQIREEQVSWRKTLLDPLLSGVLLGLLSAGTWIASKRWLLTLSVVNGAGVVGADE
jgi:hypothetical protein